MIIYADSTERTVSLEVPVTAVDGTLFATIKKNGVSVFEVPAVVYDATNKVYSFTMPYFLSQEDAEFTIEWKFDYVENAQTYSFVRESKVTVVTPYVSFSTLTDMYGIELTPEEIRTAERAVRTVINAHCGQSFGRYTGTKFAVGNGENALALPARLISLDDFRIEGSAYALYSPSVYPGSATPETIDDTPTAFLGRGIYDLAGDGWYIKALTGYSDLGIKADHSDFQYTSSNGVIYAPRRTAGPFPKDTHYKIDGVWGWEEIPEPVVEATKLLVNDYAGPDSTYRDRYLESLTSPDWRIQFNSGAFRQTGNVRADQLLSDYVVKRGWAVV